MPAVFEPSSALTGGQAQIWVAASGGPNWGGCTVLISFDSVNYSYAGNITAPTQQGTLYADFPAYGGGAGGADSTDMLSVDLTMSGGILPTNATNADADAYRTLCLITPSFTSVIPNNGEFVAYGAVAQGGTSNQFVLGKSSANPSAYIRRGLYGTSSPDHPVGSVFTRVNLNEQGAFGNSLLIYDLPVEYIGKTIWFKFLSYNTFGNALQDPSEVVAYAYTTTGAGYGGGSSGVPIPPTGLAATGMPGGIQLSWNTNPATDNVASYTLSRATTSGGSYATVWQGQSTNWVDTTAVPGTTYYYELTATNAAGTSSIAGPTSGVASSPANHGGRSLTVSASSVTLLSSDSYVGITNTSGGAITIDLPSSPAANQDIRIVDEGGNAGTYNWTIKNSGGTTVDSVTTNDGNSKLHWNGSAWIVVT